MTGIAIVGLVSLVFISIDIVTTHLTDKRTEQAMLVDDTIKDNLRKMP